MTQRKWTDEEEQYIHDHYEEMTDAEMGKVLKRTVSSVTRKRQKLGLRNYAKRLWTSEEEQYVRDHWNEMTDEELGRALNRTASCVETRRGCLGLRHYKQNPWSPQEEQYLRDHWEEMDDGEIGQALSRSRTSVKAKRSRLGFAREWMRPENESAWLYLFGLYEQNAERRGLAFGLTLEQFKFFASQPCHYCGAEPAQMVSRAFNFNGREPYNGLDRVDNSKGYILGNVVPSCGQCNIAKNDHSLDEFIDWAIRLHDHLVETPCKRRARPPLAQGYGRAPAP